MTVVSLLCSQQVDPSFFDVVTKFDLPVRPAQGFWPLWIMQGVRSSIFNLVFEQWKLCHTYYIFSTPYSSRSGFQDFFIYIFPGLFQEFLRSKLRFSKTVICSKDAAAALWSFISSRKIFLKNLQIFFRTFSCFLFPGLLRLGNLFFHVPQVRGEPRWYLSNSAHV